MTSAVSNSSPLILYSKIGQIELLHELFEEVLIPPAVWSEVVEDSAGRAGAEEVRTAGWIDVRKPAMQLSHDLDPAFPLHPGESEAMQLALELGARHTVILDDRNARRVARSLNLEVVGSAGMLLRAKRRGLVPAIAPILGRLELAGLYLSESLRQSLLTDAGEGI